MKPRSKFVLEVGGETVDDAVSAARGRADRFVLASALDLGGLTPSLGLFREVQAAVRLPVVVAVRPRPAEFVYTADELRVMAQDIELFAPYAPAGFVFGPLMPDGRVHGMQAENLVRRADGIPCVFHRSFDKAHDPYAALADVVNAGFARVLTGGRAKTALAGASALAGLVHKAAGRVGVVACGGIRAGDLAVLAQLSECTEFHASFSGPVRPPDNVGYRGYPERCRVWEDDVAAAREVLDGLATAEDDTHPMPTPKPPGRRR